MESAFDSRNLTPGSTLLSTWRRAGLQLPPNTGSPVQTPKLPGSKSGRWASRGKNNTAESSKKNCFNKAQLPCKPTKEAPRSATGFRLRSLPTEGGVPCTQERFSASPIWTPQARRRSAPHCPTTAPKMKLSSTGSAASNFQSCPHPTLSSPRKMPQSNNLSAGWVVVLRNIQSEAGIARSAPRLAGSCSSHSEVNVSFSV